MSETDKVDGPCTEGNDRIFTRAAPANVDKMEQALYISLLQVTRRMLRVTTSLEPAMQSKLLTRHFLLEHVCAL